VTTGSRDDGARVVELAGADTHDLRRRVLRVGTPSTQLEFDEDRWEGTVHLGAVVDDAIVAVSTWVPRDHAGAPAAQLRGMATEPELQGRGLGALLLHAGCGRVAERGITLVWARARDAALDFYLRHGFAVEGDGFVDEATALPHHLVVRHLG